MQAVSSQSVSIRRNLSSSDDNDTTPEDDWSGLTDPVERRRRQNRLNQRAYRRRKQAQQEASAAHTGSNSSTPPSFSISTSGNHALVSRSDGRCLVAAHTRMMLDQFSKSAYQSYMLGSPAADHLLTLSKVNVFRAFASIMSILGMSHTGSWMYDEALSPFPAMPAGHVEELKLPTSLRPTQLQRTVPHHPWLDFFPVAQIRDNLLTMGEDNFDDDQLCMDIMGFWEAGMDTCSLLVWGDPTDPKNWEVTEKFLKRWPWVVRGCPELLQSTNHWRRQRGEKLLFRYL